MKPAVQDYRVTWRWIERERNSTDEVRAATAPGAIAQLKKQLHDEYSFEANELVVIAVSPKDW